MQRRTVLLIRSDHCGWPLLCQTLTALSPRVEVVGEAVAAGEARERAVEHHPDVVIAAARLEAASTLSLLTELREVLPASTFVVVATHLDPRPLAQLAAIGVSTHLLWRDLSSEAIHHCLSLAMSGDMMVISRDVADAYLADQANAKAAPFPLTDRERAILKLLLDGNTREEIAPLLGISERTVKRIISDLEGRLDAPNSFVLGYKVGERGLLNE